MKLRTILYTAAAMLLVACSNDDADTAARVPLTVKATILGTETRAEINDDGSGSFKEGDVIYIIDAQDYKRYTYKFDGENFVTDTPFYFDPSSSESITFHAQYLMSNESNYYIEDTETYDLSNGLFNDVLIAEATSSIRNPEVTFKFTHCYSKITLKFGKELKECKIAHGRTTTICHLIDNGETAEALMSTTSDVTLKIDVTTAGGKSFSGQLPIKNLEGNHHYIFNNIRFTDKLVIESDTYIEGFPDDISGVFYGN
jgi:hypothetical protein